MTEPSASPTDADPQCPYLLQRIHELQADLGHESEPLRAQHWQRQLQLLKERARRLGCYGRACMRPGIDATIP